ncbi:ac112/ac113 [Oxyplax ochracea nucleopolyhedrovirus]|uniref:Ac112/ac113 n=1 Tax=Oxyplax ochracea nucleopolyhedrovirus TaxID=2083176 RepID=A0A2L0WU12_9ABAC|nr:ac112/ac113 [Oxyplax ochracea nucleopolyhedrovirus]AVA31132.1 ac112/ac113 [Oxyplax ochracea nucleopolyhedrovirus]
MRDKLALLFVWYHKQNFILNTHKFPFWHNIQYHSKHFDCIVVYCVENDKELTLPTFENVTFVNFKKNFSSHYDYSVKEIINLACKIDYMKMCLILNVDLLKTNYEYLQLMDMDCIVKNIYWNRLYDGKYCFEPFYDKTISNLIGFKFNYNFDSYIENYATLIRVKLMDLNEIFFEFYKQQLFVIKANKNSDLYENYIKFVRSVYFNLYNFKFPDESGNLKLLPCVDMEFRRGGSWKDEIIKPLYDYVYDYNVKPEFPKFDLCCKIYRMILFETDLNKIYLVIKKLKDLNYDFSSQFEWSNSLQCNVNLYGVLCDRIENFDVSNFQYLLPLKTF